MRRFQRNTCAFPVFIKSGIKQGIYSAAEWTFLRNKDLGNVYPTADNNESLKGFTYVNRVEEKKSDTFFLWREVVSWYLIFKVKRQLFHFYKHFWKWLVCSNPFKTQFPLRWLIALSSAILRCSCGADTIQWKRQRLDLLIFQRQKDVCDQVTHKK